MSKNDHDWIQRDLDAGAERDDHEQWSDRFSSIEYFADLELDELTWPAAVALHPAD